ncbi:MAG: efflux RND transporter permease subunit [Pseudomonadota bacterium]
MDTLNKKIAGFIIGRRKWIIAVMIVVTIFFGYHISRVEMFTEFSDLLPQKHPYIKIHNRFQKEFGGANVITIAIEVKNGTIFNKETLAKLIRLTDNVDLLPGVNHYQVASLAHRKVRYTEATPDGGLVVKQFLEEVPQTQKQIEVLKNLVHTNDQVYGKFVSLDDKAALITAGFIEGRIDYKNLFLKIKKLLDAEKDENTEIYAGGYPMLVGWVYYYAGETFFIFGITALVMILLLLFYFRSVEGVIIPIIAAIISGIWGLGFVGILGYNLDPLVLVVPLLITARAISHSVQMVERYLEEVHVLKNVKEAATKAVEELFLPGILGIVTDSAGIFVIAVGTIPQMVKLAHFCSFWAVTIIFSVLILTPILLSYFPAPKKIGRKGPTDALVYHVAGWSFGYKKWIALGVTAVLITLGFYYSSGIVVGDARPGSPILWPDSEFNVSEKQINKNFPGSNILIVVLEGDKPDTLKRPEVLQKMLDFARYMETNPNVGGSLSLVDILLGVTRVFHNDDPRWAMIDPDPIIVGNYLFLYTAGAPVPNILGPYTSYDFRNANIAFYYKDHKGDTIRQAIAQAKKFINENPIQGAQFKLAGGLIGTVAAVNEEITYSNNMTILLIFIIIYLFVAISYRSFVAGFLIVIPLALANVLTAAYMAINKIGLNINTLPVASLGVGVGVDYSIYIIDRIKQEYRRLGNVENAIHLAVNTTGKAVSFTATTLVGGIILWYFLSNLRFQAEMSILLSLLMIINMLGAMILVPVLFSIIKPKFIQRLTNEREKNTPI